ncbi:heme exporter protein CcmD [Brevundimonas intermedia]|uniref:Heme exporter protein D n=1 Tax=Brevundimonas intermedia TaxID=74315 RepID=A0A4Y9S590_9CAUL|nr:heme exporter protein CcmD [Brevundimonas intermedia]TFW14678.1 heme exporter protein CcmD [Brevundimonas intermedia]
MLDLDMTPYAAFVWPAWGVSALVLAALTARAVVASRKWKRELARLEADPTPEAADTNRPQVARSAIGPKERPQAAQGAVGPKE